MESSSIFLNIIPTLDGWCSQEVVIFLSLPIGIEDRVVSDVSGQVKILREIRFERTAIDALSVHRQREVSVQLNLLSS